MSVQCFGTAYWLITKTRTNVMMLCLKYASLLGKGWNWKNKIRYLLCLFSREVMKKRESAKSGASTEDTYNSKWFTYNSMLFHSLLPTQRIHEFTIRAAAATKIWSSSSLMVFVEYWLQIQWGRVPILMRPISIVRTHLYIQTDSVKMKFEVIYFRYVFFPLFSPSPPGLFAFNNKHKNSCKYSFAFL